MSHESPTDGKCVMRDYCSILHEIILYNPTMPPLQLFHLRFVSKQWRSRITVKMIVDALQRELPMLFGFPLDKPLGYYEDIVFSYHAKSPMSRLAVNHWVGHYATKDLHWTLSHTRDRDFRPVAWAHFCADKLYYVLQTREGRAFVLDAVQAWRNEMLDIGSALTFPDGAMDFLDNLERFVRNAFVVYRRRVTTGAIGFSVVGTTPSYKIEDFD